MPYHQIDIKRHKVFVNNKQMRSTYDSVWAAALYLEKLQVIKDRSSVLGITHYYIKGIKWFSIFEHPLY